MNESETQLLDTLPAAPDSKVDLKEETLITLVWSVKEAMFKWYGKGGVDFKKHLNIHAIEFNGSGGIATSRCLLENEQDLSVQLGVIGQYCLAWLSTKIG